MKSFHAGGLYGHLSDKNNPELSDGLFAFPIADTRAMGKTPYVEVGVGIETYLRYYAWITSGGLPTVIHPE